LLLALAALPLLALFEWLAIRRVDRGLAVLAGARPGSVLLAQRRPGQRRASLALRLGAYALLVLGAAGPEWGHELTRRPASGSDLLFVVDCSASMDARDVAPSRIDEARREAIAVLDHAQGSRVGVIGFAGDAVGLCPLTTDLAATRLVVESLATTSLSEPGTDLGRALRMAAKLMPPGRREEKVVVLWTDGEDLEHGARPAIGELTRAGVRVFAVGVGTPAGDVVPVFDSQGRTVDVKRDENGNAVRSRLDEDLLRTLARETRGGYFAASRPGGELPRLLGALGALARSTRGERLVERPVARFPWCAGAALLLLAILGLRPRRRLEFAPARAGGSTQRERRAIRAARAAAVGAASLLAASLPGSARGQSAWERGNRAYRAGRYAEAESLYARRMGGSKPAAVAVNRATARGMAGSRDPAVEELGAYVDRTGEVGRTARYNLGTLEGEMRRNDEALRALRAALERDPDDRDARWNYEVLLRRQRQHRDHQPNAPQERQSDQPQPSEPSAGSGSPPPPRSPDSPAPSPPGPGTPPPQTGSGPQSMSRQQAEQLLSALQEMQRAEQQRQQKVRVLRERRGRDW
jgi:Ca-activated chloride channel family protein